MMNGMMAPGHLFNPVSKSGVLLDFDFQAQVLAPVVATKQAQPKLAQPQLWQAGKLLATATPRLIFHPTNTVQPGVRNGRASIAVSSISEDRVSTLQPSPLLAHKGETEAGGIKANKAQVHLVREGNFSQASTPTDTIEKGVWDYFYNLGFMEDFPQVTHWYFGSEWTGRVRLSGPTGLVEGESVSGLMQFVDEEVPALPWMLSDTIPVLIHTPMPPFEVRSENLPLRLALAQLVLALIRGDIRADDWQLVTSLVERDTLSGLLSTATPSPTNQPWQLETLQTPRTHELSLRETLWTLQGLNRPLAPVSDNDQLTKSDQHLKSN